MTPHLWSLKESYNDSYHYHGKKYHYSTMEHEYFPIVYYIVCMKSGKMTIDKIKNALSEYYKIKNRINRLYSQGAVRFKYAISFFSVIIKPKNGNVSID